MKNNIIILLSLVLAQAGNAQVNFLGKPGYMATPSASWEEKPLGLSFAYLPREYSIFDSSGNRNTVNFYNARLGFASFMEVGFSVANRPLMADQIGLGDRQLDFRFRLFKETEHFPAVILGLTPPGSVSPVMAHDYLVATKNFNTGFGRFSLSGGYGSPYVLRKKPGKDGFFDALEFRKKSEFEHGNYLSGFFGGISYEPVKFGGIMFEYDTRTINAGAYLKPLDWLLLQGYSLEGKEWAFTFAFHFPLDFSPRALRRYEKNLD